MSSPRSIGIVGGGQLARMLIFEAKKLGFHVTVLDPTPNSPAGQVADKQIVAGLDDKTAMKQLTAQSDYITFDWELADAKYFEQLAKKGAKVNPSAKTLSTIKDKLLQKRFLRMNKIPVAPFFNVETKEDIKATAKRFGYPLVLKARFGGYDGKGNYVIKNASDIEKAFEKLGIENLYIEKFISFTKELAVMVARNTKGEIRSYPVVETIHKNNILHVVKAPAPVSEEIEKKARRLAENVMKHLKGAGVFGIEMFLTKDNNVLVNEIAPRVHNSGHYTIEACHTSQFAQHIRAVTGMPLGNTDMIVPAAVMVNILGNRHGKAEIRGLEKALIIPNVSVHIYGKEETKIERKMGHVTAIGSNPDETLKRALQARKYISI